MRAIVLHDFAFGKRFVHISKSPQVLYGLFCMWCVQLFNKLSTTISSTY